MKREGTKKKKLLLWVMIGAILLAAAGVAAAMLLGGEKPAQMNRSGRADLYWNVDRATYTEGSESGLSTREKGEDGMYHIRFAINGEQVELTTADKQLVNYIDSIDVMALSLDADGVIVDVLEPKEVTTVIGRSSYAQKIGDGVLTANSSLAMNGMSYSVEITELTQIYEVSGEVEPVGKIVDLSAITPLDTVGLYANGDGVLTHVFIQEHPEKSAIYWRAEQFFNSTLKQTTRLPEGDIYYMDFYCDGELVTLKTKNRDIVNSVDRMDRYACPKSFVFDEEGFIVKEIDTALGTRTVKGCERFDIVELDGTTMHTEKLWNRDGAVFSCNIAEDCLIYDVSTAATAEGRRGKLVDSVQVGDRVTVWTNTDGEAVIIYVACRVVDVDVYYVPTQKYDSTLKETTRVPNAQGYYEVEVLPAGETANRVYKTKDKALMSYLDSITAKAVGLKLNGDIIETVYDSECLFGYTPLTRGGTVPSVTGSVFTRMTYGKTDSVRTSLIDPACKIYNVSEVGTYGEETKLQAFDRIYAHRKPTGEAICIFVTQRRVGLDHLYWNMERQYDEAAKQTSRVPNEDGWYVFKMINQGKQLTLKTKSKSIANKIDSQSSCAIGLDVSGDVIVKAYTALNTSGGSVTMSGYRVKEVRDDGTVVVWSGSGDAYRERMFRLTSDGVIYNVSDAYYDRKGEVVKGFQKGDMVLVVTNINAEAEVVFIRYREADDMYWKTDRYYDTVDKVTSRVPDGEGWYRFDMAVGGKVKTLKTKDKELATKLDANNGAFGLVVDGDVIRSYVPTNWVRDVGFTGVTSWEVTAISGRTVTVKYNLPGSSNTGKTQTITLTSNAKIYDVSPTAKQFGEVAKLQVGDQIRTYQNEANTAHFYVYIMHRANRDKGIDGYCDHCGQVVHWNPYAGGSITRTDGHYYLSGNCTTADQLGVGIENADYEIVLDLNGKTLNRVAGGRFALVRYGDTLTVLDSVGGGSILCNGAEGWNGGVMYVDNGHVNLLSGTIGLANKEIDHKWGGVRYLNGFTFKMSGGTVLGGKAQRGGSIYNTGSSVIEMTGGTVTGGVVSKESGGNIYLVSDSTMKMSGGTVSNGTSVGRGGNIHVDSAVLEITGGTVTGGTSDRSADGICINSSKSSVKLENMTCQDKILVRYMGEFLVSGLVTVKELEIPAGKVISVGELTEGAKINVNALGVFTAEFEKAAEYADYFGSVTEKTEVEAKGNTLAVVGEKVYCAHCDQKVEWRLWSADTGVTGPTEEGVADHYYLESDFTNHTAQRTIKGNVVLDLRGHAYTTEGIRNFLVSGDFSVMDSVGGGVMTADGVGDDGSVAYVNVGGTFRLYSGVLKSGENANVKNGGVIAINKGNLCVYGGEIVGGTVTGKGSAIWNKSYADITIAGGMVTGSVYTVGSADHQANLILSGGTVNGTVEVGGNVSTTVSGAPVIQELDLTVAEPITLGELTENADITVTAQGVFTEENENAESYSQCFRSSDGQKIVSVNNTLRVGEEQLPPVVEPVICPHCNEEVEWTLWAGTTKPATGHYYIDSEFTQQSSQLTISANTDVVLDLHGNAYTTTGIRNFLVSGIFSVVDTVGGGSMCADGSGDDGTIAYINGAPAEFRLYSGTLRQGSAPNVKNGGLLAANRGAITILGGTLEGGIAKNNGSAIWNKRHVALTIENASVTGSVYIVGDDERNASLTLNNASVSGDVQVGNKADVTVSGTTVLSKLDLSDGKRINLGALTDGTQILVVADGVFTNGSANAKAYYEAGYFTSGVTGKTVLLQADTLAIGEETQEQTHPLNEVYAEAVKMTADGVFAAGGVLTADCPFCGTENAAWNPLTGITKKTTLDGTVSHYYLADDVIGNTSYYSVTGTVCLHLNGHTLTSAERVAQVDAAGTLNIMGDGTVSGSYSSTNASYVTFASTLDVIGNLNLCGGTYVRTDVQPIITGRATLNDGESRSINLFEGTTVQGDETYTGSACVYLSNSHMVNLYGGTITGGRNPDGNGGNIALVAGSYRNRVAQINLYGGTVENGVAAKGGNIYLGGANKSNSKGTCSGVLNIAGGAVSGGTAQQGADVYICGNTAYEKLSAILSGGTVGQVYVEKGLESFVISDAPVIGKLELASGTVATLEALSAEADITVDAQEGVFTTANADAQSYLDAGNIKPFEGKQITVTDNIMSMTAVSLLQKLATLLGM